MFFDINGNPLGMCGEPLIEYKPRIQREVWINIYGDGFATACRSKESADNDASSDRIACVRVDIDCEHGEGIV